jgi:hypothetical protein
MNFNEEGLTDKITVDFQSIPKYALDSLAAATAESVKAFLRQPGGREFLEEKAERGQAKGVYR